MVCRIVLMQFLRLVLLLLLVLGMFSTTTAFFHPVLRHTHRLKVPSSSLSVVTDGDGDNFFKNDRERNDFVRGFEDQFGRGTGRRDRWKKIGLKIISQSPCLVLFVLASWFGLPFCSELRFLFLSEDMLRNNDGYSLAFSGLDSVVIGGLSITLGTLVSTAVSVLRQRQQDIRRCLSQEAALLESLVQQTVKLFRRDKDRLRRSVEILSDYIAGKRRAISVSILYGCDGVPNFWRYHWTAQQQNTIDLLDVLAECGDNILAGPLYGFSPTSSSNTLLQVESMLLTLNNARAERRSALESTFPDGLYVTMIALMISIVFCFLLRADAISATRTANLRTFLSETPVRSLFVFVSSSFFSILQIIWDLQDPFDADNCADNSAFQIDTSVIDMAEARAKGALLLANTPESFERGLSDQAIRPDMRADDKLTPESRSSSSSS